MADEISGDTWGERLILRIAGRVRDVRVARGMSTRQLAERMTEIGHSISRQTLTNLEGGRKANLSIDDLFAMAHALEVNPMFLIFDPRQMGREIEIVPDLKVPEWMAFQWVTMQESPISSLYMQDFDDARYLTRESRRLQEARADHARTEDRLMRLRYNGRDELGEELTPEQVKARIEFLTEHLELIVEEEQEILRGLQREGVNTNDLWWSRDLLSKYAAKWFDVG